MTIKISNFINGTFVAPQSNTYIDSINPATGQVHALVPDSKQEDVNLAVNAAQNAFLDWSAKTRQKRSSILSKIADLIESRLDEFASAESRDNGKPVSLAKRMDIPRAIYNFRFFATSILHLKEECSELDGVAFSFVQKEPVGVAALISPWNLPLYLLTWKIAPCIAYGCTCVCKPSEFTSLTAFLLCSVLKESGLPDGVVNMVFGTGPNAGSPLVLHPNVPLVSFTGGTATGKLIYKSCADMNKKMSLELGGKNACLVFEDADLNQTIPGIVRSCFTNQGQICLCTSRIYVHESIYDDFVKEFVKKTREIKVGLPQDSETVMGPLVSEQHLQKVTSFVTLATQQGGKIVTGGKRLMDDKLKDGYFLEPTVILDLHPTHCQIQQQEIFGPVISICKFKNESEAISFANSTEYGLSCSVWTTHIQRAHRVSKQIKAGTVWINCWMVRDLNMPFGGIKASGLGREGHPYSMDFFCEDKTICIQY